MINFKSELFFDLFLTFIEARLKRLEIIHF